MFVNVHGEIDMKEQAAYMRRAKEKFGPELMGIDIIVEDDDEVTIKYQLSRQPFERIRRITGYLVGSLDKWNDAKRAEEHDRVKHSEGE